MNNIQLLKKAGPILGLIVSLSTTSFAGYKIFAAPLEHKAEVPSLPNPTPTAESEQEEVVETIFVDEPASVSSTPTPKVTPTSVSATTRGLGSVSLGSTGSTGSTGARGGEVEDADDQDEDHDREFDDDSDDTLTIKQEDHENEHETPEPTEKPESH